MGCWGGAGGCWGGVEKALGGAEYQGRVLGADCPHIPPMQVDLVAQGDSIYDLLDPADHPLVRHQLTLAGPPQAGGWGAWHGGRAWGGGEMEGGRERGREGQKDREMDGGVDGQKDGQMERGRGGRAEGQKDGVGEGWEKVGWKERGREGRMGEW